MSKQRVAATAAPTTEAIPKLPSAVTPELKGVLRELVARGNTLSATGLANLIYCIRDLLASGETK